MMRRFRTALLMLLALLFSINSFGYVIYFLAAREINREKRFEEIEKKNSSKGIEILSFNSSDYDNDNIVQRVNDREFKFQGKMYDIVKVEKHSGNIVIYCIHDEKEDKLEKEFADNMRETHSGKMMILTQLKFIFQLNYVELVKTLQISSPDRKCVYIYPAMISLIQKENEVLTPPPKPEFA